METTGTSIAVVYEEGVFKPQEPVPASVKPHQILRLPLPDEGTPEAEAREIEESWKAMNKFIGLWKDAPRSDYSENHDEYIYSR